jgi:hypothetical protein
MTAPPTPPTLAGSRASRFLRPGIVIAVVGLLLVLVALFSPDRQSGRSGDSRLSTYVSQPLGAGLFYQLAGRLGWAVARRTTPGVTGDPAVIHAVLAPVEHMRITEVHGLLEVVRGGAALLLVLPANGEVLNDSLHVAIAGGGEFHPRDSLDVAGCRKPQDLQIPFWPSGTASLYSLKWTAPPSADRVEFARVKGFGSDSVMRPAVVGFPLGRGRVVVAADPDLLRNDALRDCRYGLSVLAVEALEYLSGGGEVPRTRVVFDEYHQGSGAQPGTVGAIGQFFGGTRPGHFLLQLLVAGLLLLAAASPRVLAPRDPVRVERRSPFEHVDALARAYAQVGASRTASIRLVRGVRRRIGLAGRAASRSDDEFLTWAAHEQPDLADEAALVRAAIASPGADGDLTAVRDALAHIESSLTSLPT